MQKRKKQTNSIFYLAIGGLCVLVLTLLGLSSGTVGQANSLNVSVEEAHARRAAGAFILDVRTPEEWQEHHIEGATLIPLDTLAAAVSELPTDRPIVVVCRSGNRSATGRDILLAAGFEDVVSMDGGMREWISAGLPYVTGP